MNEVPLSMKGTDCGLVLSVLLDKKPHHVIDICKQSKGEGVCNFPARSRVSDLIKKGYYVINLRDKHSNCFGVPIPTDIVNRYGEDDRQGIYMLISGPGVK